MVAQARILSPLQEHSAARASEGWFAVG